LEQLTEVKIREDNKVKGWNRKKLYVLRTKSHPIYRKLRMRMYHNGRRTVDEYCMKILTPLGLLIWYLDDGSITYDKRGKSRGMDIRIHSNAYTEAENKMMMKYLNDRFGLRFNLYQNFKKKRMKRYFGLRLKAVDRLKFYDEIIAPNMEYIPPDMKYKIPNRETIVALIENPQNRKGSMEELREKYSLNSMET